MSGIPESQMSEFAPDVIALIGTGAVKTIPLTKGKVTVVDAEDYERLAKYKWYASRHRNNYYAVRDTWANGRKGKAVRMHREILGLSNDDPILSDHKNRITLDNRRTNIRSADYSLNNRNCDLKSNNSSGYRGVDFVSKCNKWRAHLSVNKKWISCGNYSSAEEAAIAYDRASIKYLGGNAVLNFPEKLHEYEKMGVFPDIRKIAMSRKNKSGYRGVSWLARNKRWIVYIVAERRQQYVGSYTDPVVAAKAYDHAAIKYYKENANLNFPEEVSI